MDKHAKNQTSFLENELFDGKICQERKEMTFLISFSVSGNERTGLIENVTENLKIALHA